MPFTEIPLSDTESTFVCNDCGAFASDPDNVIHYASCTPTDMHESNFNVPEEYDEHTI